jgi:hypothetical protein
MSAMPGELARVRRTFKEEVRLGLAYFPIDTNTAELAGAWREAFDAPLVGASTAGIAFTQKGWNATGIAIGIFGGEGVGIARAEKPRSSAVRKMRDAIRKACAAQPLANALLVLADPFSCDGEDILSALRAALPIHIRAFGATAGDDDRFASARWCSNAVAGARGSKRIFRPSSRFCEGLRRRRSSGSRGTAKSPSSAATCRASTTSPR